MASRKTDNEAGVGVAESDNAVIPFPKGRNTDANIFERLWIASNMIGAIEKDGNKDGQTKGLPYSFVSHDNVTARAKEAFSKVGIYFCPSILNMTQDGNRTIAEVELAFVNVDKSGDMVKTKSYGYGNDSQDKGPGKAYSYAVKYGLMKALMLNTDEDIERHQVDYDDGRGAKVIEAQAETKAALEAWATTYRTALKEAGTIEVLLELEKANKSRLSSVPEATRSFFIDLIQTRKSDLA